MAKAFSVVSWNVEHFGAKDKKKKKPKKPVGPIVDYLKAQKADIYAVYEVVGSAVWKSVLQKMPDYQWHITEGPQTQEILVGVRKTISCFFTQRLQFKSGQPTLRPGALLTARKKGKDYVMLFLHLKSLPEPKGFGVRDDQTKKAIDFRKTLDKIAGGENKSNYLFLGDLNTMGMNLTFNKKDITEAEEIERLKKRTVRRDMSVLSKAGPTFWPKPKATYPPSALDHVVAANHLKFKKFSGHPVDIRGWPEKTTKAKKNAWAKKYSDHALLYFEVQEV
jgi:hypothetical protein